jgi:hypothetical protein
MLDSALAVQSLIEVMVQDMFCSSVIVDPSGPEKHFLF